MGYIHGGKVVARALRAENVPFVFTLCGGHVMSIYDGCLDEGIRVIALLPGATDTPIWDTLWPDAPREKMIRAVTVAQVLISALKLPQECTIEELDIMPTAGAL